MTRTKTSWLDGFVFHHVMSKGCLTQSGCKCDSTYVAIRIVGSGLQTGGFGLEVLYMLMLLDGEIGSTKHWLQTCASIDQTTALTHINVTTECNASIII